MNSSIIRAPWVRLGVLLAVSVLALAGCSDGSSSGGVAAAALSVTFNGAVDHPENVINDAIKSRVDVAVTLPASSKDSDVVTVTLSDGSAGDATAEGSGPGRNGGGELHILVDATGLADGPIDVLVQATTDGGAAESSFTAVFTKDTVAPELPTTLGPLDAQGAPSQWVNLATATAATVNATFANAGNGEDMASLVVLRGGTQVAATPQTFTTTSLDFQGLDLTPIGDGEFDLQLTMTDAAMNAAVKTERFAKDTVAPVGALASQVWPGISNPSDTINIASAAAVSVLMGMGGSAEARTAVIVLGDGTTTVSSAPATVPMGGGFQWIDGTDASTLVDGPITLVVNVFDAAGNMTPFTGTPATKDTVAPSGPTTAAVMGSGANPASVINLVSSNAVGVTMNWPAGSSSADSANVSMMRGGSVTSGPFNPPAGGGSSSIGGLDATGLAEGTVAVTVTVADAAGNSTTMTGTPAFKDSIPPTAPTIARVAAGPANTQDVVNLASVGSVGGVVTFPASAGAGETFVMTFDDSITNVAGSPTAVPPGGGSVGVGPISLAGLNDGFVSVSVSVSDAAQNMSSMSGTIALKDTIPPTAASAASIAAGPNNAPHVINMNNVGTVSVDVTWPAGAPGTEAAQLVVTAGGTVSTAITQIGGGGSTTANVDATSLTDGPVTVSVVTTDAAGNTASFSGSAALKDTMAPVAASSLGVPPGGSNPADWVNGTTAGSATVQATMPAGSSASDMISVTATNGSATVTSALQACPAGAGVVTFTMNLGGLNDGEVTLSATVLDTAGNTSIMWGAARKDVVPPANPEAANVPSGPSNPADMINTFTVLASNVSVSWPGDQGNESMYVVLSDGTSSQATPPQTLGANASQVAFGALNCSPLADGAISVMVSITDRAGNVTQYPGTPATKDTQPPSAPTSAHVAATPSNAIHVINAASSGSVSCDVTFGAGNPADVATVTLSDGSNGVSTAPQQVVAGGTVSYSGINAGFLTDGAISVAVNVVDVAGNVTVYGGTAATKDTVAPSAATSVTVPAGPGHTADHISAANASSVTVNSTIPGQGAGVTASCTITDGMTSVNTAVVPVPPGGGLVSFSGMDCSGLSDGPATVTVTVMDPASNGSPAMLAAAKDVVAPTLLVDPTTTPTSAAGQTVTGETEAGATVSISGGAAVATGSANASGRFAIAVMLTAAATNNLAVGVTDAAGNTGSGSGVDFTLAPLMILQDPAARPVMFTDMSVASGLDDTGSVGGGAFQDLDGDGDLDLFVGGANRLWSNDGSGVFTDQTLGSPGLSGGVSASFADYDNDGDLDMLLVDGANSSLMRNEWVPLGVFKFTDQTLLSGCGVSGSLTSGLWLDMDGDGWVDCAVADTTAGLQDRFNAGGAFSPHGVFGPVSTQMFFGVAADLVQNGRSDIVIADAPGSFLNNAGGSFTDISSISGVGIKQSAAAGMIVADVDNDGDLDLVVSSGNTFGENQVWLNNGTTSFTGAIGGTPVGQLAGISVADGWIDLTAGDVNNDGRVDLWVGRNGANRLFLNVGDTNADGIWEYVEVAGACGIAGGGDTRLVQLADVDGDGDLDVYAGNEAAANELYRNEINNHRNLTVMVNGLGTGPGTASKDAVGAHVELRDAAGTTILASREMSGGRGYGSQDPLRAHFGVTPSQIYTVRVTFPSGAVRTATNVIPRDAAGQTITVNE